MSLSDDALELGGTFRRPWLSHVDQADRSMIGAYLRSVLPDGRTIAQALDDGESLNARWVAAIEAAGGEGLLNCDPWDIRP